MNLRNGKIKSEPIDSDDDNNGPKPWQQYEYTNGNQLAQIKCEPVNDDVDVICNGQNTNASVVQLVKSKLSNQRRKSVGGVKMKSQPISIVNQPDELKVPKDSKIKNLKRCHKLDSLTSSETKMYCCYLCDKSFQFLCRLKTHMLAHTNRRQYQCEWCFKRYKNSSSLSFHHRKCHLGKPRKYRSKSTSKKTMKKAVKTSINNKQAVETQNIQPQNEYEIFNGFEMEPLDDVEMEWAPLGIDDDVPFVWDESDLSLILPIESAASVNKKPVQTEMNGSNHKVEELSNQMNINSSNALNIENMENKPTMKMDPSKFAIWEKETDDTALYVDILQAPKSKRTQISAVLRLQTTNIGNIGHSGSSKNRMKNTELAIKFRGFGDAEFSLNNWYSARQWYNRSLCYAEQKSQHFPMAYAYAKRAQCYLNEGIYRACWTDLMLAQNSGGLPEVLLQQLECHKKSCIAMINKHGTQKVKPNFEPMLSFPPDSMFPEMSTVLQINCNEYFGRHIGARQSIGVGQILMIENGFVATSTSYYERCCICLADDSNLIPCSKCTQAMSCRNCEHFHQIECELQMALNLQSYPWATKVLRSILNAINLFGTIDEMMKFVDGAISSWRNMQPIAPIIDQKSTKYRAFLQLITLPTVQPALHSMVSKLHAALLDHPAIRSKFTSTKHHRFLAHLLVHHICVINAFTVKVGDVDDENGCLEIIAPITSYVKHSCSPNVSKFLLGQSVVLVAMRPIEPGEQLFVSYCDILKNRNNRQAFLQMEYGFQCSCERCTSSADILWDGQPIEDHHFHSYHRNAIGEFVRHNFVYLTGNDQVKRKEISDHILDILQRYGRMPWNYTIMWAYVAFSLLLSQRFQKKLQY